MSYQDILVHVRPYGSIEPVEVALRLGGRFERTGWGRAGTSVRLCGRLPGQHWAGQIGEILGRNLCS